MRFGWIFAALLLMSFAFAPSAMAQAIQGKKVRYQYTTSTGDKRLLNAVALNASANTRTIIVQTDAPSGSPAGGYDLLTFLVNYTAGTATDVRAQIFGSLDGGITYGAAQSSAIAGGVDTLSDYIAVKSVTANKAYTFTANIDNYTHVKVVFSGTGAGSGDLLTVYCIGGVQ